MKTRTKALLRDVSFMDYHFVVEDSHGGTYLKAVYMDQDVYTGATEEQHTRKWLLSPHMTDSEVVQTAFKLCLTSMEHRTREAFKYKGARIFGPHYDVEDLVKLCIAGRDNAGGRRGA